MLYVEMRMNTKSLYAVRLLVTACLAAATLIPSQVFGAKQEKKPADNQCLKVVYFIPNNRQPEQVGVDRLKAFIKVVQQFYQQEMARNGFYKPGTTEGKTFTYAADEKGDPYIYIVNGKHEDAYYGAGVECWCRVAEEVAAALDAKTASFFVVCETHSMNPDSTMEGACCQGGAPENGSFGGMAIIDSACFGFMGPEYWGDERSVNGLIVDQLGKYPLKHDVTFGGANNDKVGTYSTTGYGALSHELGHAFGMPHCFIDDEAPKMGGKLMGRGSRGFRGNFANFPGEYCHICKPNCVVLAVNRIFNFGTPWTDKEAPKQSCEVVLEEPMSYAEKNIRIKIKASDSGSGLWYSCAVINPPWSIIDAQPFDSNGIAEYSIDPREDTYEELKPQSYCLEVTAGDKQGNWSVTSHWVPVPQSLLIECPDGDGWREIPDGCVSPSEKLRLAVSMTSLENDITLTPEVEAQPIGKPFAGKANFSGEGVAYKDNPVTGHVNINLANGPYHLRYRLVSSKGKKSCWVEIGSADPMATDIRVNR
jgi:hypothetical protein